MFFSLQSVGPALSFIVLSVFVKKELIYFNYSLIVLQWDIFIAKVNKNSGTFFEAILRNVVTY